MASFARDYPSPLERQFTRFYNPDGQYAHLHKNKSVALIGLSKCHPLLASEIEKVEFSKAACSSEALGKRKRGALRLQCNTHLCSVTTSDGKIHRINAQVNVDLVEVNLRLLQEPRLLVQDPEGAGFLCVGLTRAEPDLSRCFPNFTLSGDVMKFRPIT